MGGDDFGGGLWILVAINSVIFIAFAASFFHPRTRRDWRVMGAYSAFIVALFTEMYGFPLTIYVLSGWLGDRVPGLVPTHAGGHLLNDLIGWQGDPHLSPFHLASYLVMGAGFVVLARAWPVLWKAQRVHQVATTGPYRSVRHPQYVGFLLIMAGFLLQWPTLLTLLMFPILALAYTRLAISEEGEVRAEFGDAYEEYAARTPRFLPYLLPRRAPHAR
ncbi:MAG: isoprenylcysteine carboxylmethyltransferase family protein [Chloroflexi bacterium]|nr:isoprenylcysteine carboxylmethyltransferase family protein [Chloroflexota bacterium]